MRKIIFMAALMAVSFSNTVMADEQTCFPPISVQVNVVTNEIAQRYIEAQGWCDQPAPEPKAGQIVIYYERDAAGNCVAKVKQAQ